MKTRWSRWIPLTISPMVKWVCSNYFALRPDGLCFICGKNERRHMDVKERKTSAGASKEQARSK